MFFDGLEDAETGRLMGAFAQETGGCLSATTRFVRVSWGYLCLESSVGLHFFRPFVRQYP
jgi:hypothetical protein